MRTFVARAALLAFLLSLGASGVMPNAAWAQAPTSPVAPTLIAVSGRLATPGGQPRTGPVQVVISLYDAESDEAPRWIEQQLVVLDAAGSYSVQFGATLPDGLPGDLFSAGAGTRWVGVKALEDATDRPRVMLVSVPYAAKAATAETLGGKSAADFVLTSTFREDLRTVLQEEGVTPGSSDVGTAAVTANYVQKGDGGGGTTDSTLFESGGLVGVGTTSPISPLHIVGPDNTINAFPEVLISDSTAATSNVGGGFGFQGKYTAGGAYATFAAVKGGKDDATSGNYTGYLSFWTQPGSLTERMRITSGGSVGIGEISPGSLAFGAARTLHLKDTFNGGVFRLQGAASNLEFGSGANSFVWVTTNTALGFATNNLERLRITNAGNVGIGTSSPTSKLDVAGSVKITGDITVDGNIAAKYQDVAEWVDSTGPLEAGTIVIIDSAGKNRVTAATRSYDSRVAGAVSPQPGLILGEPGEGKALVAQSGRVRVKADAKFGAIKPGDLLVTSPTKGHVMRSRPVKMGDTLVHRPGTLVGKALEGLAKGQGEILVLLTLQ